MFLDGASSWSSSPAAATFSPPPCRYRAQPTEERGQQPGEWRGGQELQPAEQLPELLLLQPRD